MNQRTRNQKTVWKRCTSRIWSLATCFHSDNVTGGTVALVVGGDDWGIVCSSAAQTRNLTAWIDRVAGVNRTWRVSHWSNVKQCCIGHIPCEANRVRTAVSNSQEILGHTGSCKDKPIVMLVTLTEKFYETHMMIIYNSLLLGHSSFLDTIFRHHDLPVLASWPSTTVL